MRSLLLLDDMYCGLGNAKFPRRLAHGGAVFDDVCGRLTGAFLDVSFHDKHAPYPDMPEYMHGGYEKMRKRVSNLTTGKTTKTEEDSNGITPHVVDQVNSNLQQRADECNAKTSNSTTTQNNTPNSLLSFAGNVSYDGITPQRTPRRRVRETPL